MNEIIFLVEEAPEGGYIAKAVGTSIVTEADNEAHLREQVQDRVDALSVRVGPRTAHLIRIDALGKRLTQMENRSSRDINFDHEHAVGGPGEREVHERGGARLRRLAQLRHERPPRTQPRHSPSAEL